MKTINIPESQEHLGISLTHTIRIKVHWTPRGTLGGHVPTNGIGSFFVEVIPGVDHVAL